MEPFEFDANSTRYEFTGDQSGFSNYSDSVSTVAPCPATVLSNVSPLDSQLCDGRDTRASMYGQIYHASSSTGEHPECLFSEEVYPFSKDLESIQEYPFESVWSELDYMKNEDPALSPLTLDAHQSHAPSMIAILDNNAGILNSEGLSVLIHPHTTNAPVAPDVNISSATVRCRWPNVVWLICACNRFKVPQATIVVKGVMKKKGMFACEMRIMKEMQKEKKKSIPKVWLGTYKTPRQAARALDVGKFFFNAKKNKRFYDPNSATELSKLGGFPTLPLEELVKFVKKVAQHFAVHGSLQNLAP